MVVVGDKRPFVGALITLDAQMLRVAHTSHGLASMTVAEAAKDRTFSHPCKGELTGPTSRSRGRNLFASSVFSVESSLKENGLLTPSLKVKRAAVLSRYADQLEELYRDTRS